MRDLLDLMLNDFISVPMSLVALHRAMMSEVTLNDTTLWALCSVFLESTSVNCCTVTMFRGSTLSVHV